MMRFLLLFFIIQTVSCDLVKSVGAIDYASLPVFNFPTIDYGDILTLNPSVGLEVSQTLITLGFLQIKNIPRFEESRLEALRELPNCLLDSKVTETIMNDGSRRETIGGISKNGNMLPLENLCSDKSSAKLRALTTAVTTQLFRLLDRVTSKPDENVMDPYKSYEDLINHGEHLEHFHVYHSKKNEESHEPTMNMHTDNGMMIAMTTGHYDKEREKGAGLYIELPSGAIASAGVRDDCLVIMIGEGALWTNPILGSPMRPVPHAMIAGTTSTRAWYGKMLLPPNDALMIDPSVTTNNEKNMITYQSYRAMTKEIVNKDLLPIACGSREIVAPYQARQLSSLASDDCDGVYCWMKCMSVASLSCGYSAVCVDTVTDEIVDGYKTCPDGVDACELQCVATETSNASFDGYCTGSGLSMYMDGFNSMAFSEGSIECLNLLFVSWTLDSPLKFGIACVGVFLMSVLVQMMTNIRQKIKKGATKVKAALTMISIIGLYGIQVTLSYLIMLAAMTYSVEMFCMVCSGLTVGYALFNLELPAASAEPCCDIDIDVDAEDVKSPYDMLPDGSSHSTFKST